jgi:hypothetical protein
MARSRRWLAAAVFLLVLAACTSAAGRPGHGTGPAGTPAGSGPAAPGGLSALRHVWVIELENQQRLGRLRRGIRPQPGPPERAAARQERARRRPQRRGPAVPLIRPGTISVLDYNHYSLLRTMEEIFGPPHLGNAAMPQVRSFGPDVFG